MGCMASKDVESAPRYRAEPAVVVLPEVGTRSKTARLDAEQAMEAMMEEQKVEIMASRNRDECLAAQTGEGRLEALWDDDDDDSFITVEDDEVAQDGEAAVESKQAQVEYNEPAEAPVLRTAVIHRIHGASSLSPITSSSSDNDDPQQKHVFSDEGLARGMEFDVLAYGFDDRDECGTLSSYTYADARTEPKPQPGSTNSSATRHQEAMTMSGDLQKRLKQMKKKSRKVDKNYRKEDFAVERKPFQSEPVRSMRKSEVMRSHQNLTGAIASSGVDKKITLRSAHNLQVDSLSTQ